MPTFSSIHVPPPRCPPSVLCSSSNHFVSKHREFLQHGVTRGASNEECRAVSIKHPGRGRNQLWVRAECVQQIPQGFVHLDVGRRCWDSEGWWPRGQFGDKLSQSQEQEMENHQENGEGATKGEGTTSVEGDTATPSVTMVKDAVRRCHHHPRCHHHTRKEPPPCEVSP